MRPQKIYPVDIALALTNTMTMFCLASFGSWFINLWRTEKNSSLLYYKIFIKYLLEARIIFWRKSPPKQDLLSCHIFINRPHASRYTVRSGQVSLCFWHFWRAKAYRLLQSLYMYTKSFGMRRRKEPVGRILKDEKNRKRGHLRYS